MSTFQIFALRKSLRIIRRPDTGTQGGELHTVRLRSYKRRGIVGFNRVISFLQFSLTQLYDQLGTTKDFTRDVLERKPGFSTNQSRAHCTYETSTKLQATITGPTSNWLPHAHGIYCHKYTAHHS